MTTKKRSHRNNKARLTAEERVTKFCDDQVEHWHEGAQRAFRRDLTKLLAAHARDALARHKRREAKRKDGAK
jgi:hypothetical protein